MPSPRGDLTREAEADVLAGHLDLLEVVVAEGGEAPEYGRHELFWGRGAGRQPDALVPGQQVRVEPALAVDQEGRRAGPFRDLDQAARVRARLGADHEDQRGAAVHHRLDRVLAVLGRVADVVGGRPAQVAE